MSPEEQPFDDAEALSLSTANADIDDYLEFALFDCPRESNDDRLDALLADSRLEDAPAGPEWQRTPFEAPSPPKTTDSKQPSDARSKVNGSVHANSANAQATTKAQATKNLDAAQENAGERLQPRSLVQSSCDCFRATTGWRAKCQAKTQAPSVKARKPGRKPRRRSAPSKRLDSGKATPYNFERYQREARRSGLDDVDRQPRLVEKKRRATTDGASRPLAASRPPASPPGDALLVLREGMRKLAASMKRTEMSRRQVIMQQVPRLTVRNQQIQQAGFAPARDFGVPTVNHIASPGRTSADASTPPWNSGYRSPPGSAPFSAMRGADMGVLGQGSWVAREILEGKLRRGSSLS